MMNGTESEEDVWLYCVAHNIVVVDDLGTLFVVILMSCEPLVSKQHREKDK